MPPKRKGKGKGHLKKTQTSEVPRDTPPVLLSRQELSDDDDEEEEEEGFQDLVLNNTGRTEKTLIRVLAGRICDIVGIAVLRLMCPVEENISVYLFAVKHHSYLYRSNKICYS